MNIGPGEHPRVPGAVSVFGEMSEQPPGRRIDHGQVDGVTIGVTPDDELVLLCQHGHERWSFH
jgi:hypothetical protein